MRLSRILEARAGSLAPSTEPAGRAPPAGQASAPPTSQRLRATLLRQDVRGEKAIAVAQGGIALFVLVLHVGAQLGSGLAFANPWVILTLSALVASSSLRLFLAKGEELPERTLDGLNVADIAIFLLLIWSYQYAYQHPAGGILKAPSVALLFVLVAVRALRFHPRPILLAGGAAVAGWALLVLLAVLQDGAAAVIRSYPAYLTSYGILIGAEIERLTAITALGLLGLCRPEGARNPVAGRTRFRLRGGAGSRAPPSR